LVHYHKNLVHYHKSEVLAKWHATADGVIEQTPRVQCHAPVTSGIGATADSSRLGRCSLSNGFANN
jgi:hypothetical protein